MSTILKFTILIVMETVSTTNDNIFPFKQFWNLSSADTNKYISYGSCKQDTSCCECHEKCFLYGTCCIDKLWVDMKVKMNLEDYIALFLQESKRIKTKSFTCEDIYPPAKDMGFLSKSYLMVTSCVQSATPSDVTSCQSSHSNSLEDKIPVIGSDGYIYKNRFCALCNLVPTFRLVNIGVICLDPENNNDNNNLNLAFTWKTLKEKKDCIFSLNDTDIHVTMCNSTWNKRCPRLELTQDEKISNKTNRDSELCDAYTGGYRSFPNFHCWKCKHESMTDDNILQCPLVLREINRLVTLYMLLQFTPSQTVSEEKNPLVLGCKGDSIPDINLGKCIQKTCPNNYKIDDSKCVNILFDFSELIESMLFKCLTKKPTQVVHSQSMKVVSSFLNFKISKPHSLHRGFQNVSTYIEPLASIFDVPRSAFIENGEIENSILIQTKKDYLDIVLSKIIDNNGSSTIRHQLFSMINSVLLTSRNQILIGQSRTFDRFADDKICVQYEPLEISSLRFTNTCDILQENSLHFQQSDPITINVQITKNKSIQRVSRCKKFINYDACLNQNISHNDVTFTSDDSLVYFDGDGRKNVSPVGSYIPLGNTRYGLCVDEKQTKHSLITWIPKIRNFIGYVSFVGHVMSCFCHVLVLVTFCLFEPPRHGLLCLCMSLFMSDLIFLVIVTLNASNIDVSRVMCRLIAASIHFVLLSVQACSVASAIDLFVTLGNRLARRPQSMSFRKMSLCVLLFPLTILLLSLILANYNVLDIRYGEGDICWFTGFNGRLLFYIIPGILTFSVSIGLITYTVFSLSQVYNKNKKVLKGSGAKNVSITLVALKLVITYGVSEAIGFIQIPLTEENMSNENERIFNFVFEFLYTIFRSYRGVLLFVIYVCRRSMIQKYKRLISCGKQRRNTSSIKENDQKCDEDEDEISEANKTNDFKDIMNSIETSLSTTTIAMGKELFDGQLGEDYDRVSTTTQLHHMISGGSSSADDVSFMWNMYEMKSSLPKDKQVSFYQPESYITKSYKSTHTVPAKCHVSTSPLQKLSFNLDKTSTKCDVLTIEDMSPVKPYGGRKDDVKRGRSKTVSSGLSDDSGSCHAIFKD